MFGFRKGLGTRNAVFIFAEMVGRRGGNFNACFVDAKKEYDSVWREGLWLKLCLMGLRGESWRMLLRE